MAVIFKLIWYQDGYEQPSEEDLKRIMNASPNEDEEEDPNFRHITEITILTVQLIVEFAKGLPAFTKIPQEDQITLLKVCISQFVYSYKILIPTNLVEFKNEMKLNKIFILDLISPKNYTFFRRRNKMHIKVQIFMCVEIFVCVNNDKPLKKILTNNN